jgi:hypothetical protein
MLNAPIAIAQFLTNGTGLASPFASQVDALLLLVIGVALILISQLIQGLSKLARAEREKYEPLKNLPQQDRFAGTDKVANAGLTHESEHV